uniref:Uncharacterized protein n=1 Tax=Anguilla anguilla TaxID=7936 RepID=A0A0E9TP86_ANGAN
MGFEAFQFCLQQFRVTFTNRDFVSS